MNKILGYIFLSIGLFSVLNLKAQIQSTKQRIADSFIAEGNYYEAIDVLEEIAEQELSMDLALQLAKIYQQINYFSKAEYWFKKYMEYDAPESLSFYPQYAEILKAQQKYVQANEVLENYLKAYKGLDKNQVMKLITNEIENNKYAHSTKSNPQIIVFSDTAKNFVYNDLAPVYYKDTLFFTGIPLNKPFTFIEVTDSTPLFNIFYWTNQNGKFAAVPYLPNVFYEKSYHTANLAFSLDGKRMYFTRCKENLEAKNICAIYGVKQNEKGKWMRAQRLTGGVNCEDNDWSSTHPTLNYDTKKKVDILYFSSNRPGGIGEYDLYYCTVDENFNTDLPKNLGRNINTVKNELTPFYEENEQELFFSSNGLGGMGSLDIFKAKDKGRGRFDKAQNLGMPINSGADDYYYFKVNDSLSYMSSNRLGAQSLYKGHLLEDIFTVKFIQDKFISFSIYSSSDSSKILKDAQVLIKKAGSELDEIIDYQSILSSETFKIYPKNKYFIIAQKNNYLSKYSDFQWDLNFNEDTLNMVIYLDSIIFGIDQVWEDIFFETNSAQLQKNSMSSLNKLLEFLWYNPNIIIEIQAHTDNVGTAEENEILSQQRAQNVADFLIKKGIGDNRLIVKGFGDKFPIATNENEEGRALNRRVSVKIVSDFSNNNKDE